METSAHDVYAAAHLYYERGLTQDEVAQELGVSRQTISRLLSRAVEESIVSFVVREPNARNSQLESALTEVLGLDAAVVVAGSMKSVRTREILRARAALNFLEEPLQGATYVGVGWGRGVLAFVEALEQRDLFPRSAATVVPLVGGSGQIVDIYQTNEIARRTARALGASARVLHAPVLVKDSQTRAKFLEEPSIKAVWEAWQSLDVAILGIGRRPAFILEQYRALPHVAPYVAEYLDNRELGEYLGNRVLAETAVGDVCAHFFDEAGRPLAEEYEARSLQIGWEQLRRVPLRVGVAGGKNKVLGIVGAAHSRLINTLVTDEETANNCLKIALAA